MKGRVVESDRRKVACKDAVVVHRGLKEEVSKGQCLGHPRLLGRRGLLVVEPARDGHVRRVGRE